MVRLREKEKKIGKKGDGARHKRSIQPKRKNCRKQLVTQEKEKRMLICRRGETENLEVPSERRNGAGVGLRHPKSKPYTRDLDLTP